MMDLNWVIHVSQQRTASLRTAIARRGNAHVLKASPLMGMDAVMEKLEVVSTRVFHFGFMLIACKLVPLGY